MAKGAGTASKTAIWILMGLLIVGLAGFGATNFSGTVRSIGSVGTAEIGTGEYARALENEMRSMTAGSGQPMTVAQAEAQGVTQAVLARLVVIAALEHEADAVGLSVGDEQLARDLAAIDAFRGPDGAFDRDAYAFALRNAGLTEAEFEADLRAESAATLLQAGVLAGTRLPPAYAETLVAYTAERRSVTWARLGPEALTTGLPVPSEDDLRAFHEDNIDRYTRPEARRITYAWLTPDMIVDTVTVDEAALRDAYEESRDRFNMPERRLVERLVFSDRAAAETARDRINAGEAGFADVVADRGLALADTDMGDMDRAGLGEAADAVFAAETGAVVVAPSPLGPALYRVNGVLDATETSFEDAAPMLRDTLALDRARRVIEGLAQSLDDELAAGATLEQLAADTDLRLGTIAWTGEETDTIAGYEAFRERAAAVTQDDFPEIDGLGDGGLFALRLDGIDPPAPIPFEDVRDTVAADWEAQARTDALIAGAEALRDRLSEGASFDGLGLQARNAPDLTRGTRAPDLPRPLIEAAFDMEAAGDVAVRGDGDGALILRLDAVEPADTDSEEVTRLLSQIRDEAASSVANDLFRALASDIQERAGVEIDQAAINAVHAQMP